MREPPDGDAAGILDARGGGAGNRPDVAGVVQ
jgi:hypothetical protein